MNSCVRGAIAAVLLAGCGILPAIGPEYDSPVPKTESSWHYLNHEQDKAPRLLAEPAMLEHWWTQFQDETLNQAVQTAIENNRDIAAAEARLAQARALRSVAISVLFPSLNTPGEFSRSNPSNNTKMSRFGNATGSPRNDFRAGLDTNWEIDVFGGVRRGEEAAEAQLQASAEDLRSARLSVAAETARSYFEIRAFQKRLHVAAQNIAAQEDALRLVESRYQGGLTSELDVLQARSQLERTKSGVPELDTGLKAALSHLSTLSAQQLSEVETLMQIGAAAGSGTEPFTKMPDVLRVGVPSDVLRLRPDIRAAERRIAAETAKIGVASADLFPRFSLLGGFGFESEKSSNVFEEASRFWNITPGVRWPVFSGGKIRANIELHKALTQEAIAVYEQTVLDALSEAETAIISLENEQARFEALQRTFNADRESLSLSRILYQRGLADFLRVLDAERASYFSEDQLVTSEVQAVFSSITLFKALGVGFGPNE